MRSICDHCIKVMASPGPSYGLRYTVFYGCSRHNMVNNFSAWSIFYLSLLLWCTQTLCIVLYWSGCDESTMKARVRCRPCGRLIAVVTMAVERYGRQQARERGVVAYMRYPSEAHLQLKSDKTSFVQNLFHSCIVVLKSYIWHCSITAKFCAKFPIHLTTVEWVMSEQNFAWFELMMSLRVLFYIE